MNAQDALPAILREKDAETEYLRNRNLQLSIAIDNLAAQVKELQPEEEAEAE